MLMRMLASVEIKRESLPPGPWGLLTVLGVPSSRCNLSVTVLLICAFWGTPVECRSSPADAPGTQVSAEGFVTQIVRNGLSIDSLSIQLGTEARCSRYDEHLAANRESDGQVRDIQMPCAAIAPKVGDYVHVRGEWSGKESIVATDLQVNDPWRVDGSIGHRPWTLRASGVPALPMFRYLSIWGGETGKGKLQGGSFLEEPPVATGQGAGTATHLWLNGLPLEITKDSIVRKARKPLSLGEMASIETNDLGDELYVGLRRPPFLAASPTSEHAPWNGDIVPWNAELVPGAYLGYSGTQDANGHLVAGRITVFRNGSLDSKAAALSKANEPKIAEPQYDTHLPGAIQFRHGPTIAIIPDRDLQKYVQGIGDELVPAYQKAMATSDPAKIRFRFYIVRPFVSLRKNTFIQIDGQAPKYGTHIALIAPANPFFVPADHRPVDRIVEMPDGTIPTGSSPGSAGEAVEV